MAGINQFSMKSRLMALLMGVSLGSVLILGILSWLRFRAAFQHQVFDHLTSVRASKGRQVESYIKELRKHLEVLSEDHTVVSAMVNFNTAYRSLQNEVVPDEWIDAIDTYYARNFLPALADNVESPQIVANYRPLGQASQYLQYHYLIKNTLLNTTSSEAVRIDNSTYAQHHSTYHPILQNLIDTFGYDDLYLIDFNSGEIVYSVNKRSDYATSLDRGPYRRSSLADVVAAVRDNPGRGFVQVVDFKAYVPKLAAPVAFFATPIFNGPHIVGIIALQIPPDRLNDILVGTQDWAGEGLGDTGQVYIVGDDTLMRSVSRELLEDPKAYQAALEKIGLSPQVINLVDKLDTSTLLQPVDTVATRFALAGESNTQIIQDYQDRPVLSAYAPLKLDGLRWAILAEIDKAEALGPITRIQIYMSIVAVSIILVIALLAGWVAQSLVNPMRQLIDASQKLQTGESIDTIPLVGSDEVSQLGASFKQLVQALSDQSALVTAKNLENETLLRNILPATVATRFRQGEESITDAVQQATVLSARIIGLVHEKVPAAIAIAFSALISEFDRIVKRLGLEPQSMADETYLAVCGLSDAYFDHQERGVKAAQAMLRVLQSINEHYQVKLSIQIGIHSGAFVAGVVGTEPFAYKLWGDTIRVVTQLPEQADPNQIVVTQPVYERLKERYDLSSHGSVTADGMEVLPTWHLVTDKTTVQVGSSVFDSSV